MLLIFLGSYSVGHVDVCVKGLECVESWFYTSFYGNPRMEKGRILGGFQKDW